MQRYEKSDNLRHFRHAAQRSYKPAVGGNTELGDGLRLYRLPSSSRAYPLAFEKKCEAYRRVFEEMWGELGVGKQ